MLATPYQYLTNYFLIQIGACCRVAKYINGEDDMPVCIDWEDFFPLPEDLQLQDFNHLRNNPFEVHLSIPMYYNNFS